MRDIGVPPCGRRCSVFGVRCWGQPHRTPAPLPDGTEHLAAQMLAPRLAVRHQALGGAHNRHPQPVQHPRQFRALLVDPDARLADPLDVGDHALPARTILEADADDALLVIVDPLIALDITLLGQDLHDLQFELRARALELVMVRPLGVADPGEQVRDRISHCRHLLSRLPTGLGHTGDEPLMGHLPETDTTDAELAEHAARAAADVAPGVLPHLELRRPARLLDEGLFGHQCSLSFFDFSTIFWAMWAGTSS